VQGYTMQDDLARFEQALCGELLRSEK
jgi:hypothetical protein